MHLYFRNISVKFEFWLSHLYLQTLLKQQQIFIKPCYYLLWKTFVDSFLPERFLPDLTLANVGVNKESECALSIFFYYAFAMFTFSLPVFLDCLYLIVPAGFYNIQYQWCFVGSVLLTFLVFCVVCLLFDYNLWLVPNVTCVSELSILSFLFGCCFQCIQ
jgi:hypothetical protein